MNQELVRLATAVDIFSHAMKAKLYAKVDEGYAGWDNRDYFHVLHEKLQQHVERELDKSNFVDIANLAMMLWFLMGNQQQMARKEK